MLTIENFIIPTDPNVVIESHNDLDGGGPVIIGDHAFEKMRYFNVANGAVDKILKMILFNEDYKNANLILLTDISIIDRATAEMVDKINKQGKKKIYLFDHHDTALWLNEYDWAIVTEEPGVSGTLLFFKFMREYLTQTKSVSTVDFLQELSIMISDWDTWTWTKNGNNDARELAELFKRTGMRYFLEKYKKSNEIFTDEDRALMEDLNNKMKFIIMPGILKTAKVIEIPIPLLRIENPTAPQEHQFMTETGHKLVTIKCVSVADAPGDLAESLYEDGIDHVFVFYSTGTVSMRSRVNDIHLGHLAKHWGGNGGGGGHDMSAGFTLNQDTAWIYLEYIKARYNVELRMIERGCI